MDGSTDDLSLFDDITSLKNVIILDAINHSNTLGKITKFTPKNIKQDDINKKQSFHQDSIAEHSFNCNMLLLKFIKVVMENTPLIVRGKSGEYITYS